MDIVVLDPDYYDAVVGSGVNLENLQSLDPILRLFDGSDLEIISKQTEAFIQHNNRKKGYTSAFVNFFTKGDTDDSSSAVEYFVSEMDEDDIREYLNLLYVNIDPSIPTKEDTKGFEVSVTAQGNTAVLYAGPRTSQHKLITEKELLLAMGRRDDPDSVLRSREFQDYLRLCNVSLSYS